MSVEPVHHLVEARNLLPKAIERLDLMRNDAGELPDEGLEDAVNAIHEAYTTLGQVYQRMTR